jgi:hypothetical protein
MIRRANLNIETERVVQMRECAYADGSYERSKG